MDYSHRSSSMGPDSNPVNDHGRAALGSVLKQIRSRSLMLQDHDSNADNQSLHNNSSPSEDKLALYRSYCRHIDGESRSAYESTVRGWLYQPGLNRKGKLMMAAIERLVGVPSNPDTSASNSAVNSPRHSPTRSVGSEEDVLVNVRDSDAPHKEDSLSGWVTMRPQIFRNRSGFLLTRSRNSSRANSRQSSRANSRDPSPSGESEGSPNSLHSARTAHVEQLEHSLSSINGLHEEFRGRSPPSTAKQHAQATKQVLRERLAAVSHRSLALRDIIITVFPSDPRRYSGGRSFNTRTDEGGRFSLICRTPFEPGRIRVRADNIIEETDVLPVPVTGVSVISDIDDTVRLTGVTKSKREVLQNVLLKSFDQVKLDGVAEWYNQLAAEGAQFHYVSNSPWQLYDSIHGFLQHHNFPDGSIHLKRYQGIFDGIMEPAQGRKRAVLEAILQDFPQRKFILIGDSGEADLEAYCELAQKFPKQILAIYIRDITLPPEEPLLHLSLADPASNVEYRTWKKSHSRSATDLIDLNTPSRTKKVSEDSNGLIIPNGSNGFNGSSRSLLSSDRNSDSSNSPARSPPPALPQRPSLPRRGSSRFSKNAAASGGVAGAVFGAMASATSVAHQAAAKLLAPPLPPRPAHLPSSRSSTHSRNSSLSQLPSLSAIKSHPQSQVNTDEPAGFLYSGQEPEGEHERVDKRVESWRSRVFHHHRSLPEVVRLRTWRTPDDIKEESIRLTRDPTRNPLI